MKSNMRNRGERGSSALEFALVTLFLIPSVLVVVGVGLSLGNSLKVSQTVRDTGHMFGRGVSFNESDNKQLVVRLAGSLGLTENPGGNGRIILSKIITPVQADCMAANRTNNCPNRNMPVFTHRISIGNTSPASQFGTPAANIVNTSGNISVDNYLSATSARTTGFAALLTAAGIVQGRGEIAYLVEGFFRVPSLAFLGSSTSGDMYCRYIF
jgi:hypothetical protein